MRRLILLVSLFLMLSNFQMIRAQDEEYPVISVVNARAVKQIGIIGGDQGRIAISPDDKWMAVAGLQGVWLIDLALQDSSAVLLTGHTRRVNGVDFSPDSKMLASGSRDGTVRLWSLPGGELIREINAHSAAVSDVDFDSTGTMIASASGGEDKTIRIWQVNTGEELREFSNVEAGYFRVSFVDGLPLLVAGTLNSSLAAWNLDEGRFIGEVNSGFNSNVTSVDSSGETFRVAVGLFSGRVIISDVTTGDQFSVDYHDDGVREVAFSRDGRMLASVGMDDKVVLMDALNGELITEFERDDFIYSVAFSGDGQLLYAVSNDGKVTSWNIARRTVVNERTLAFPTVRQVVYDPLGRFIVVVTDEDHFVRVFDANTLEQLAILRGHTGRTFAAAYSPRGRLIATAGGSNDPIRLWNGETFALVGTIEHEDERIYSMSFSPVTFALGTGGDRYIRIWNANTRKEVVAFDNEETVWSMAFSPDGSLIAASSGLWNAFTREKLPVTIGEFSSVAISPRSDVMVTTENFIPIDPQRKLIAETGFTGLNNNKVAFSPDGSLVAMGVEDEIRLIDVEKQQVIATLTGHGSDVRSLAFSPDGSILISGGYDATIRRWAVVGDVPLINNSGATIPMNGVTFSALPEETPLSAISDLAITSETIEWVEPTIIRQAIKSVVDLAVAPDGSSVVVTSLFGVYWLDLSNPDAPVEILRTTSGTISSAGVTATYSRDGRLLAVSHGYAQSDVGAGGGITVWDVSSDEPQQLSEFPINGDRGFSIAISNQNTLIAVGLTDKKAQIFDLEGNLISTTQEPLFGTVNGISFFEDDKVITLSDTAGNKGFFNVSDGAFVGGFNSGIAYPMWWSSDYSLLYSAEDSGLAVRNGTNVEIIHENPYPEEVVGDIKATDTANGRLVVASNDTIWFLDYADGSINQTIGGLVGGLQSADVTLDGTQLIGVTGENVLRVWDIETGTEVNTLPFGFTDVLAAEAVSSDGMYYALGNEEESIRIIDVASGEQIHNLPTDKTNILKFIPETHLLAVSDYSDRIELWDVEIGELVETVTSDDDAMFYFSDDAQYMVSRNNERLTLQDIRSGAILFDDVPVHLGQFRDVDISPRDDLMATAGVDGTVRFWDLGSREQVRLFFAHTNGVSQVEFAPDRRYVATLGDDGVKLWDFRFDEVRELAFFEFLAITDNELYFSADGSLLFAHVFDEIIVWSVDELEEVARYKVPNAYSSISADGRQITATDEEGSVYILTVMPEIVEEGE